MSENERERESYLMNFAHNFRLCRPNETRGLHNGGHKFKCNANLTRFLAFEARMGSLKSQNVFSVANYDCFEHFYKYK